MNYPSVEIVTVSPWTLDARGYLRTPSGCKAARLDSRGTMWLWDKRTGCEVPFTLEDWQTYQTQMTHSTP